MVLLDRDQDTVLEMIEDGHLAWAWDIRSPDAERREIRIWRSSLIAQLALVKQPDPGESFVLASILPHRTEIRTPELQRIFMASQWLIQNLINLGAIKGLNSSSLGPNGFVRVSRESVINFLRNRRVV